jgi:hypothetical protein
VLQYEFVVDSIVSKEKICWWIFEMNKFPNVALDKVSNWLMSSNLPTTKSHSISNVCK